MTSVDVLVIGGGVIGFTAALELAEAGLSVEVADRGDFGREASWAGAGIIPPGIFEKAATPIDRLRAFSSSLFPRVTEHLCDATGIDTGYRVCGGIEFDPGDEVLQLWADEGITIEKRDSFAYWLPEMAQVRNPRLLKALIAACDKKNVRLSPHCSIESLECRGNSVEAAIDARGTNRKASHYLVAAGAWTSRLLPSISVFPVRGQIILYRCEDTFSHIVIHDQRYLVPRGEGLVLVGSTEEPEAGFVNETTSVGIAGLRDFAETLFPQFRSAAIVKTWAGLRPGSRDGMPFIGFAPDYDNLLAATGHFRSGIQLSLGTARMIGDLILKRPPTIDPMPFRLDRPVQPAPKLAFRS